MTKFDKDYLELVKKILTEGVEVENRTGINTLKIPSHNFEFDLSKEFPVLQSKQFFARQAITEMLWIWQMQSNKVKDLHDRNVNIWDEWEIDEDGIYRIYEPEIPGKEYVYDPEKEVEVIDPLSVPIYDPYGHRHEFKPKLDENGNVMTAKSTKEGKTIRAAKYFGKELAGTIGTAYGFNTGRYQMTQDTQYTLKNIRTERRIVNNLYQNEFLRTSVLPPCVYGTEWDVTGDKLTLLVHQRSCDVPLGLPFNVTQYATMLKMMAQTTGLEASKISYSIKDAHIYVNQIEAMKEQLRRWELYYELKGKKSVELAQRQLYLDNLVTKHDNHEITIDKNELELFKTEQRIIDIILNPTTPELWLNPDIKDFFDFDNSIELKDSKVKKYKHMGKLTIPRAQ